MATTKAIMYGGVFSSHDGMSFLSALFTPIPGASRDYAAGSLTGTNPTSWVDLAGGPALSVDTGEPALLEEGGIKFVRFDGVNDSMADTTATRPAVHTVFLRYRTLTAPGAYYAFVANTTTTGVSVGANSPDTAVRLFAGNGGGLIAQGFTRDTGWHTIIAVVNGASSVISVDGIETTGNPGPNTGTGLRIGGNANLSQYTKIDVARVGFLPYAADATERAAIISLLA